MSYSGFLAFAHSPSPKPDWATPSTSLSALPLFQPIQLENTAPFSDFTHHSEPGPSDPSQGPDARWGPHTYSNARDTYQALTSGPVSSTSRQTFHSVAQAFDCINPLMTIGTRPTSSSTNGRQQKGKSRAHRAPKSSRSTMPYDVSESAEVGPRRTTRSMVAALRALDSSNCPNLSDASSSSGPSTPGPSTPPMGSACLRVTEHAQVHGQMGYMSPGVIKKAARKPSTRRLKPPAGMAKQVKQKPTRKSPLAYLQDPATVICRLLVRETGKYCTHALLRGDLDAFDEHIETHLPPGTPKSQLKGLQCTWEGCEHEGKMSFHDWRRHLKIAGHLAVEHRCPVYSDRARCHPQRRDAMVRHVRSNHIAHGVIMEDGWEQRLELWKGGLPAL
ncbi:hypothetical protein CERSUDRAFT_124593 [Gelatoporia subvermispora B]|uniref:Uncharacterized protein n=1 Tax=Ceriporiopsis subvermispora (strain B) TaxID=914234 RepID=M2QVG1_CERS8|nr:hypothetical protein CERSUDRAFT_124593 [Gelatoporia subvermispora B]